MTLMKKALWFTLFVYLLNIIVYFGVVRNQMIAGYNEIVNDPATLKRFEDQGVVMSDLKKSAFIADTQIFNPLFNISYSIGNMKMILVNIVLSGILTYYLTRKKNSLDKESVVNDSQQS